MLRLSETAIRFSRDSLLSSAEYYEIEKYKKKNVNKFTPKEKELKQKSLDISVQVKAMKFYRFIKPLNCAQ